ncbi:hypothetical protein Ddye_008927 [Dipteronia dyeriana]|uniref:Uncharacterized protein n=1 Tax=Dipteronia dyeriana TaxID=168575 RepID=A0AAD9XAE6_9ROSI|nr:hypothetical protein Ddye_008927 [Dipteronia dyeriana]
MADIAMLVAEEYERRVKLQGSSRNREDDDDQNQMMMMIKKSNNIFDFKWINNNFVEIVKHEWILLLEPKTQIALAASNGFFSA